MAAIASTQADTAEHARAVAAHTAYHVVQEQHEEVKAAYFHDLERVGEATLAQIHSGYFGKTLRGASLVLTVA